MVSCVLLAAVLHAQDFHFAIMGDRTGETVPGVYEQIWREIAAERPAFAINVGDTIQGLHDATARAEWNEVRPVWTRYRIPFYFTPGNHDIWSALSRRVYEQETQHPASYSFNYGQAHFTVLDNSGSMQLSNEQLRFLKRDLDANAAKHPKFVFFHQPFWLISLKLGSTNFAFHELARQYGVDYVVSGHVHQYDRVERDGIVYLTVGSSGGHLRGHDKPKDYALGWFFQHMEVRVTAKRVEVTVREIGPPFGEGRSFVAGER